MQVLTSMPEKVSVRYVRGTAPYRRSVGLAIHEELYERLKQEADRCDASVSLMARLLVEEALDQREAKGV